MNILLASNNEHKKEEFSRILTGHTIVLPRELGIDFDYEEDAETFTENALGKARALASQAPEGYKILADDSGLCIDALEGRPGVRTARYGLETFGRMLESGERNEFLLKNMAHLEKKEERSAQFVCALAFVMDKRREFTFCETVDGFIAKESYGEGGFGYDPVFIVKEEGKTMAELSDEEKDRYSHRGKASHHLITLLGEIS
ncbi:RdgB/HAM1 family non-canonical purine NTP pyrophosphatase [Sphaerochaeta halotolerans]|uniref:dITP/XTP pyrophosphatase n=1 Tax=Sphaerochaeta halotolerans TaxID=2293840 RepID=A0A372MGR1_9SPIR|nr:RdgB/HAM1 family non-canonical purine NTP pyrophosphatase [Sphaerochaeta halotolerans]RFU94924.1 RdgB/HAM1 family non-canonical purine NTP pyrophosphatase [Sphaerochaeta halotolerans]